MYTHPFNVPFTVTAWVRRYQKKHLPTHTHPDHHTSFINFLHLLRSIACSLFNLRAWQSFSTTPVQVLFGLSLGLGLSASYYFFTLFATCPYHHSLFCCCTNAMSSISNLSLGSLLGNLSFTCHISIWPFSSLLTEVRPHFLSLQARSIGWLILLPCLWCLQPWLVESCAFPLQKHGFDHVEGVRMPHA